MAETPSIPEGCQWGLFLRNHDELTLEMVSDAERDELYAEYAHDPKMRRNTGIGRRLAPLLDNQRPLMELFHALLFSMPGSPVLYYGDEIGMGDNIHLGDRDGVRTPMQWTPDRNAGFSTADFEQLYLPTIMDPVYGFQAVNVEAQRRNPGSFLHWIRRMIGSRKRHPQLALGSYTELPVANTAILAYLRGPCEGGPETILCVANLSRAAQPAEIPLQHYDGRVPVELLGRVEFPPIGQLPYLLTLPPNGFLWFELR